MELVHSMDINLKEEILESGKYIWEQFPTLRNISLVIAWKGAFIERYKENGSWQVLGFEDQHQFRIAVGIGKSNWYRLVGAAQRLSELTQEQFLGMKKIENIVRLSKEDYSVRYDLENIAAAAELSTREFKDRITSASAHREGKPKNEQWVDIHWRMQKSRRDMIEGTLRRWAKDQGIAFDEEDASFVLELLLADISDRASFVGFMLEAAPKLTDAVRDIEDISELKLRVAEHIIEMDKLIKRVCGPVVEEDIDIVCEQC